MRTRSVRRASVFGQDETQRVGPARWVLRPRAVTALYGDPFRWWSASREHAHDGRARRRDELARSRGTGADGMTLEELQRGRRGYRQHAVRSLHRAVTHG